MKRLMLLVVGLVFLFTTSAFAQDKVAPAAAKPAAEVKAPAVEKKEVKKAKKAKKAKAKKAEKKEVKEEAPAPAPAKK